MAQLCVNEFKWIISIYRNKKLAALEWLPLCLITEKVQERFYYYETVEQLLLQALLTEQLLQPSAHPLALLWAPPFVPCGDQKWVEYSWIFPLSRVDDPLW